MLGWFRKKKLHKKVLILNAIPYLETQFESLYAAGVSDFTKSVADYKSLSADEGWEKYKATAALLTRSLQHLEKLGATVVRSMKLEDLANLAADYDTVVLIAHHSNSSDEIEIDGRLVPISQFISTFPTSMKGIVDLTSCYSSYLIPKLKVRNPDCRFIGIDIATSLNFRLFLLEETLGKLIGNTDKDYKEALSDALGDIAQAHPEIINMPNLMTSDEDEEVFSLDYGSSSSDVTIRDDTGTTSELPGINAIESPRSSIKLGADTLKSTVYAPAEVSKGDDFMVQIFIHCDSQSEEVSITAKMMDEDASVRSSKTLTFKLLEMDKVEFQLVQVPKDTDDFTIETGIKGVIWNGEPASVEFAVSVSESCKKSSFIGKVKIAVNKLPVGDILFKTKISDKADRNANECAEIQFNVFDREKESIGVNKRLLDKLSEMRSRISESDAYSDRDLQMCETCIELLSEKCSVRNQILRVFISSTSDMKRYRLVMKQQVDSCQMYADMYELWGQDDSYPRDMCCKHVLESDVFVCILGSRYGFIEPLWNLSMTEIEYRIAEHCGIPILIYIDENWREDIERMKDDPAQSREAACQESLIDELRIKRMVHFFQNENRLASQALAELLTIKHTMKNGTTER